MHPIHYQHIPVMEERKEVDCSQCNTESRVEHQPGAELSAWSRVQFQQDMCARTHAFVSGCVKM